MTIDDWQDGVAKLIAAKLEELDSGRELQRIDVGVFPWHSTIELSALFTDDAYRDDCFEYDVASWPQYNYSQQQEGRWTAAEPFTRSMNEAYLKDPKRVIPLASQAGGMSPGDLQE